MLNSAAMSKIHTQDIETARKIVLEALADFKVQVYLFGSQATGQFRPNSDIDVAILPQEPLPPHVLPSLRQALEESNIVRQVDIVDLTTAEPSLVERIVKEGILWRK